MEKIKSILFIFLISIPLCYSKDFSVPSGEEYITGEDGIKRMYINIWGHVKSPGPYLVYEDIDIVTLLSVAGGPLDGADLSKIKIVNQSNYKTTTLDMKNFFNAKDLPAIELNPYDTIIIEPTLQHYLFKNASTINVLLQLLNLGISLSD